MKAKGEKGAVSAFCLTIFAECFLGLAAKSRQSKAECDVLTVPKSCQKGSFQLSRQSYLFQNSTGFLAFFFVVCDKEELTTIQSVDWEGKKSRGRLKSSIM